MDYNSVVDPSESGNIGSSSILDLNVERKISLASLYTPSLTVLSRIDQVPVDPVSIFVNFLVSLAPKYLKGAFQQVAINASANVEIPDSVLDVDDAVLLSTGLIYQLFN